jgi:CubicO group peptidase (beta-lactamase class C family)
MTNRLICTARIDANGGPDALADHACVPWWSFTKTVLAAGALRLVAQGVCSLDDHIDDRRYTLRQLLQHRAGVPNYAALQSYHDAVRRGDAAWTVEELLDRVRVSHLDFEPGHGWCYSNVGYLFVRRFIERTVGRDIGGALRTLLLDALGLDSVRLAASSQDLDDTAWGNAAGYDPGWVYHGLLIGTPGDAARFLHCLMAGAVLPPELLAEMTAPHPMGDRALPDRPWQTTGYGLGLMIGRMERAGIAVGHSGAGPTSVTAVYHFRDLPVPCTVSAFAEGSDEGRTEYEAVRLARSA